MEIQIGDIDYALELCWKRGKPREAMKRVEKEWSNTFQWLGYAGLHVDEVIILYGVPETPENCITSLLNHEILHVKLIGIETEGRYEEFKGRDPCGDLDKLVNCMWESIDVVLARQNMSSFTKPTNNELDSFMEQRIDNILSQDIPLTKNNRFILELFRDAEVLVAPTGRKHRRLL